MRPKADIFFFVDSGQAPIISMKGSQQEVYIGLTLPIHRS